MMQSCYLVPRPFMFKLTLERDLSKDPDFCVQAKFTNLMTNSFFMHLFAALSPDRLYLRPTLQQFLQSSPSAFLLRRDLYRILPFDRVLPLLSFLLG